MTAKIQTSPFLKEQFQFPNEDVKTLSEQVDHVYLDIAQKVNSRTIGLMALNYQVVNGEQWYFKGSAGRQNGLRQVYSFSATGNIAHGINWPSVSSISPRSYGTFTDGTNWYGLTYSGSTTISGQVTFYVTPTNIIIAAGAGAPSITSGYIVLEWVSNV